MAKDVPNIVNRDIIQRLNFLYQASVYLSSCPPSNSSKKVVSPRDLAKEYISTMRTVGQKTTVRIDPAVKRTICKGCNITLIPGTTATVRIKKSASHGNAVLYTCNNCKTIRRIPAPPSPSNEGATADHPIQPLPSTSGSPSDESAMTIDSPNTIKPARQKPRKKKERLARVPPLFARHDAGHVVFRGNERLPPPELGQGTGIFIV